MAKPRLGVHKFTSCDGCQLAFLNAGEAFLQLSERVDVVHFAEAGMVNPTQKVDIAFVEGSVSTPGEEERIKAIRANCTYLITIGACATTGGLQALRNAASHDAWMASIYPAPQDLKTLDTSTAIAKHVRVDWEIWGCPVNTNQVLSVVKSLLAGAAPLIPRDSVCLECKQLGNVCVVVTQQKPCMGPVTQTGCGALCPSHNRPCYGCYGPSENPNTHKLGQLFTQQGMSQEEVARHYLQINSQAKAFAEAGAYFKGIKIVKE